MILAGLGTLALAGPATAQLDSVGSEAVIGANGTGEQCRARHSGRCHPGYHQPMVVVAATANNRGFVPETYPTNVRVLEAVIGVMQGRPMRAR